jgi:DNA polymerase III subunit delta'
VVVLHPVESLNQNAANALLKILEEPPPATLFVLVTHQLSRILPTIRSRCHKIAMPLPSRAEAEAWLTAQGTPDATFCLAQSGGSPLTALEIGNDTAREEIKAFAAQLSQGNNIDPFVSAASWGKGDYGLAILALQKWSYDLMSNKLAGTVRYNADSLSSLQSMGNSVDLRLLLDYQHTLAEARAQAAHPLNSELQLEALLVRYAQLFSGSARS